MNMRDVLLSIFLWTDSIRPICLPLEESLGPKTGDIVMTSGWGEEEDSELKNVKIKKRVRHTLLSNYECELGNPALNPVCALTLQNSTSYVCPGDNGGPLMYQYSTKNRNWVALGIIIGTVSCVKYQPVIAERITPKILNWIIDNIKP